jgi:hypothetical protein
MTPDERLTEIFDRGLREGVDFLTPTERDLYLIQDFIIEYEMNGLSGYFYNRLPDLLAITSAAQAMQRYGLTELSQILSEAAELFRGYADPEPPTTWRCVLQLYDPGDRLSQLSDRVVALRDYGLADSTIR